jgi:hypothetical protein
MPVHITIAGEKLNAATPRMTEVKGEYGTAKRHDWRQIGGGRKQRLRSYKRRNDSDVDRNEHILDPAPIEASADEPVVRHAEHREQGQDEHVTESSCRVRRRVC